MANELVFATFAITFTKANVPSVSFSPKKLEVTVTGTQWSDNVQLIGTVEEAVLLGDVATGGYWYVENMDATNFVELRSGTLATDFIRLNAGEWAIFRVSADATAPFAIADTAAVNVRFLKFDS